MLMQKQAHCGAAKHLANSNFVPSNRTGLDGLLLPEFDNVALSADKRSFGDSGP
jgi:hypothetical protein